MNILELEVEPLAEAEARETDGGLIILLPLGPLLAALAFLETVTG